VDALLQNRVFWIIASALALLLCFWQGLKRWRTATLIANTPASRLRSAAQGYIEVCGIASNGAGKAGANPAPLSRRAAVWWSYTIEEPNQRGRGWHTVEHRVSEDTFLLTDEGCFCAVDPEGAAVYGAQQQVWYGEAGTPPGMGVLRLLGPVSGACPSCAFRSRRGSRSSASSTRWAMRPRPTPRTMCLRCCASGSATSPRSRSASTPTVTAC